MSEPAMTGGRGRRRAWIAVGVVGVLVVAYSAFWGVTAALVDSLFADWVAAQRRDGTDVAYGAKSIGGFPLAVRLTLDDVTVSFADGTVATADRLTAAGTPWAITLISVPGVASSVPLIGDGEVHWQAPAGFQTRFAEAPGRAPIAVAARAAHGNLGIRNAGQTATTRAVATDVTVDPVLAEASPDAGSRIGSVALGWSQSSELFYGDGGPAQDASVEVTDLRLPTVDGEVPLGRDIAGFLARIEVTGAPLLSVTDGALGRWKAAGGAIHVKEGAIDWGPLSMTLEGSLGIDHFLQPEADITARIAGLGDTAARLAEAGALDGEIVGVMRFLDTALSGAPGPDGRRVLTTGFRIAEGRLNVAGLPDSLSFAVPQIPWPRGP